jgi:hypothetical protein
MFYGTGGPANKFLKLVGFYTAERLYEEADIFFYYE